MRMALFTLSRSCTQCRPTGRDRAGEFDEIVTAGVFRIHDGIEAQVKLFHRARIRNATVYLERAALIRPGYCFRAMTSRQRAVSALTNVAVSARARADRFGAHQPQFRLHVRHAQHLDKIRCKPLGELRGNLGGPATANHDVETKPGKPA